MYQRKYHKYKTKYLNLVKESGFGSTDDVDYYDADDLYPLSDDELELDLDKEKSVDQSIEDLPKGKFLGYDVKGESFINENLNQTIVDIGLYGKARGKIVQSINIDPQFLVKLNQKPTKEKYLVIDNNDDFNNFTDQYGYIKKKDKNIYIKWDKVAQNYKGIYLKASAQGGLEDDIPYQGRTVPNWLNYDFDQKFIDNTIMFIKERELITYKKIKYPFNGKISDEYAIPENEFSRITDQITHDKILLIDDLKSFDQFTNKYGYLIKKKKLEKIDINWNDVKRDYDGFYIDKDIDLYKRVNEAYYQGRLYPSWIETLGIEQGIVYIFN